ncbi:hypothetical protein QR680_012478 [Steinernema hermaphroditum]|uniref:BED-type domain-containing protein n=1 Tax=Steinernema hermaphroditum TaxID=289476 RepID=A0AA39I3H2_9BILA|nr:hypothetical protein QR680_012478 [Steinernema hermaphroditum]
MFATRASKYDRYFDVVGDLHKCTLCEKTIKKQRDGGTNNMRFHLKMEHKTIFEEFENQQNQERERQSDAAKASFSRQLKLREQARRRSVPSGSRQIPTAKPCRLDIDKRSHTITQTGVDRRLKSIRTTPFGRKMELSTLLDPRFKASFFTDVDEKHNMLLLEAEKLSLALSNEREGATNDDPQQLVASEGCGRSPPLDDPFTNIILKEPVQLTPSPTMTSSDALLRAKQEVDEYFSTLPQVKCDPYEFWSSTASMSKFPLLRHLALRHFTAPATSAESERLFSAAGLTISDLRTRLSDELVEKLLFLHTNIPQFGF